MTSHTESEVFFFLSESEVQTCSNHRYRRPQLEHACSGPCIEIIGALSAGVVPQTPPEHGHRPPEHPAETWP